MEFFADRNLGGKIFPGILRDAGLTVHVHDDHFADAEADAVWLPQVAARGWIVLSRDRNIQNTPIELDAVMRSGAAMIIVIGASLPARDLALNFLNSRQLVADFVQRNARPFVAKLYRPSVPENIFKGKPGSIELKETLETWAAKRGLDPRDFR